MKTTGYCSLLLLFATLFLSMSCRPPDIRIQFTNNTSETLSVYVTTESPIMEESVGEVPPGVTVDRDLKANILDAAIVTVTAKNQNGDIVFTRKYTRRQWLDTKQRVTITLP